MNCFVDSVLRHVRQLAWFTQINFMCSYWHPNDMQGNVLSTLKTNVRMNWIALVRDEACFIVSQFFVDPSVVDGICSPLSSWPVYHHPHLLGPSLPSFIYFLFLRHFLIVSSPQATALLLHLMSAFLLAYIFTKCLQFCWMSFNICKWYCVT